MEINNNLSLLNYTVNKKVSAPELMQNINFISTTSSDQIEAKELENEISVNSIGSTLSDEAIEKLCTTASVPTKTNPTVNQSRLSTTFRDFSPSEISKIKQVIYNIHNGITDPITPTPDDPDPDPVPPTPDEPDVPPTPTEKSSFITEFCDVDTMFEYLNTLDSSITKSSGLSKAQLVALTQDDDWEDSNNDFFGSLNRIFDKLDTSGDNVLSYSEIKTFIGEEIGSSFSTYQTKVNNYSDQIQREYERLSDQKKLEFAIEKTEEYLQAAGMQDQLDALNRLLEQTDRYNTIKVGNIAIADLNAGNNSGFRTLGSYNYTAWSYEYENKNGETGEYALWANDNDNNTDGYDLGITLDISLLNGNWYTLVNTLVRELTHATAYRYYADNEGGIDGTIIIELHNKGIVSDEEYNYYIAHWSNICSGNKTAEEDAMYERLQYLLYTAWGEYSAYQADADYNDSIGQDVYKKSYDNATTAVNGNLEKDTIANHIDKSYEKEIPPDYKWWSYA